jgi:hypothetical protein
MLELFTEELELKNAAIALFTAKVGFRTLHLKSFKQKRRHSLK